MTTTNGGGAEASAPANQAAPQLNVLAQYVKDLSFENPNAPRSLQQQQAQPQINIQINVNAKPLADNDYEVDLKIEGRAEVPGLLLFSFELLYAGVFRIVNVPQENLHADHHDRVPAAAVPVRARTDRHRGAQWRLPAADDRSGGFRLALPPEDGKPAAGGLRRPPERPSGQPAGR